MNAEYPERFTNSVINTFQKGKKYGDESFIIHSVGLPNLSYPLKYPNVNSMNSNQSNIWRNLTNALMVVSEL